MRTDIKPYPGMKDSSIEWLGKVPEHWEVLPGRACYYEKREPNTGMVEKTVLSLSYGRIIVKPVEKQHGLIPESFETYQVINPGDIICRPTDLQNDHTSLRFGFSENRGIITSAYMCFGIKDRLERRYGHLLLHSYDLKKIFYGLGSGLRQNLSWDDFKYLPCVAPPYPEQAAIVRYLDHVDRRVRRLVRAKRKLVALLTEQKQAIIHHAVTHGLNPGVSLKDSGVEWLGEVPKHWRMSRLGRMTKRIGDGLHGTPQYVDSSEYRFVNGNNLANGRIVVSDATRCVSADDYERHKIDLDDSTILMSINGTIGNLAYFFGEAVVLGKSAAYLKCGVEFSRRYLFYILQSRKVLDLLCGEATGTTILNLSLESLRHLPVPLPTLREQSAIVKYLKQATAEIDNAIARANRTIELLNEYRIRLIADVVTGKLDVREAAATLPEVGPLAADDESDHAFETDIDGDLDEMDSIPEEIEA